jgi:murein DD-endopeptidase MepM/ murein hydrolase activator NlpD
VPDPPEVTDVICKQLCAAPRKVVEGSRVEFTGRRLGGVNAVRFQGSEGEITVTPNKVTRKLVRAKVPEGAVTGKPVLLSGSARAPAPRRLTVVKELPKVQGGFRLNSATAQPHTVFFDARRQASVAYRFEAPDPTDVLVEVVKQADGSVVSSQLLSAQEPFTENVARWNGMLRPRKPAPQGRYRFRIGPRVGGTATTTADASFILRGHKFPVRARHSFGDGFGAPRSGHSHQGVDIFARCGSPIVAARGGRVYYRGYQSAAGHYLVIKGRANNRYYVYMHLKRRSPLTKGKRVRTGQRVGLVGETGNASGCHLHFEVWRGTWYGGGSPARNIKPMVRKWDSWS